MSTIKGPLPAIISMLPGKAVHHFASIEAPQTNLEDILKLFVLSDGVTKVFIVDKITFRGGWLGLFTQEIRDVLIYNPDKSNPANQFFTYKGRAYDFKGNLKFSEKMMPLWPRSEEERQYRKDLELYRKLADAGAQQLEPIKTVSQQLQEIHLKKLRS